MSSPNGVGKVFNLSGGKTVTSFNGRTGAVRPRAGDYTAADVGALSIDGTADAARKLATLRTIRTNLSHNTAVGFDGTDDVTPGVIGTLDVSNGGTGSTTSAGALANLGADNRYLKLSGGDMTGMIDMQNNVLTGIPAPVSLSDAVNLQAVMNMIVSSATRVKVVFEYAGGHYGDYTTYIPINDIWISGLGYIYTVDSTVSVPRRSDGGGYTTVWLYYILGTGRPGPDWSEPSIITKITLPDGTVKSLDAGRGYYSTTLPTSFQNGNVTISGTMTSIY